MIKTAPLKKMERLIDGQKGTPFEKSVWKAILKIRRGEVRSYQWVAERIGRPRACRAVGNALRKNPLAPVVPCHRVVGKTGIGGYAGGLEKKRRLLSLEAS